MTMNPARHDVNAWIAAYERAWRTPGTEPLGDLFAADAAYRMSPYAQPVHGLTAIAELWERERKGADEAFEMSHEIVAVEGDTAVVRVEVKYGEPAPAQYRDLWVVRFAADGCCREFEEWPFWPGQQIAPEEEQG
jgi:ketosteroid isomerase-like protein